MQIYAYEFCKYMNANGIKYTEQNEDLIKVAYTGENLNTIPVYVFFDQDNAPYVQLKCWEIQNFKNNEAAALVICNSLNAKYRWVKFYLDNDKDIVASIDAIVDMDTCGEVCLDLVRRIVSILDEAYPQIAKARWA